MNTIQIHYRLTLPDGGEALFDLCLDAGRVELIEPVPVDPPDWVKLTFHQCPSCPLSPEGSPNCPLAVRLLPLVARCEQLSSFDEVDLEVVTPARCVRQHTSLQRALGSLMGVIMPASGCPLMTPFRPMARFHLPLATEEETIFRATAAYRLAQYFRQQAGLSVDETMAGLERLYRQTQTVNAAIARRLRAAGESDAGVNAVVLLDLYAQVLPLVIEEALEELRPIFWPFLDEPGPLPSKEP